LVFLALPFAAQATLTTVYCELSDSEKILQLKRDLRAPYHAAGVVLDAQNEVTVDEVRILDGAAYTSYDAFGDKRLSISIEQDGEDFDIWFVLDGEEDEISHFQVGFNSSEEAFTTEVREFDGGLKFVCGGY
jgi:hypothetical protein